MYHASHFNSIQPQPHSIKSIDMGFCQSFSAITYSAPAFAERHPHIRIYNHTLMCEILPLGALIKGTNEYVYPKIAKKTDKFECPDCHNDLIVRQGKIRIHHFAHKVDSECKYYSHPSESQIHRDAKMLLKTLFDRKTYVYINRHCCGRFPVPVMTDTSKIVLEHRFDYNGPKVADVAYLDGDRLAYIFEICHTHKTHSDRRPEPWFEIDAKVLLKNSNDYNIVAIMQCIRNDTCGDCLKKIEIERLRRESLDMSVKPLRYIYLDVPYEKKHIAKGLEARYDFKKYKKWMIRSDHHNMAKLVTKFPIWKTIIIDGESDDKNNIEETKRRAQTLKWSKMFERIIRERLGQTVFPSQKYFMTEDGAWEPIRVDHLRFDFDARDDPDQIQHNKKIIDIFEGQYKNKRCVLHSHKGGIWVFVVLLCDYSKYNYWDAEYNEWNIPYPYLEYIDYSGHPTTHIIQDLILRVNRDETNETN